MKKIIFPLLVTFLPLMSNGNTPGEPVNKTLVVITTSSYNTFELVNPDGVVVYTTLLGNAGINPIDISGIAAGTYVYRISGNESSEGTVVIKH